jgi:hypothetical protein
LSLEALSTQPGTLVTKSHNEAGEEVIEIQRGGVIITQEGKRVTGIDHSGKGAILCLRMFALTFRETIYACGTDEEKAAIDGVIDNIDDFVVLNSLDKITKDDLERDSRERLARIKDYVLGVPPELQMARCQTVKDLPAIREWLRDLVDGGKLHEMLSVPRPPVMAPCI